MRSRLFIVWLVSFAAFLGPFTQSIYTPILPEIELVYHTSTLLVNLTISVFTFFLAIMQIIYGPLVDQKGRKKILLAGLIVYGLASIGCAMATSIWTFLLFRSVQAIGIATGSVVAATVIGDLFEGKERGRAMGIFQMLVSLGPVLGPTIGGIVGNYWGHQGPFFVLAAVSFLALAINSWKLPETKEQTEDSTKRKVLRNSFVSILLHPIGSVILPLGFIQYYCFYQYLVFLPDVLTRTYHLGIQAKGFAFLPLSVMIVTGSYLGGRLQENLKPQKALLLTSIFNVVAILLFIIFSSWSLAALIVCLVIFGLCLGLSLPIQTTLLTGTFIQQRATAIGAYNFLRFIGMACGPLIGTMFYDRGGVPFAFGFAAFAFSCVIYWTYRQFYFKDSLKKAA